MGQQQDRKPRRQFPFLTESLFRAVVDASPDGVVLVNEDGIIVFVNPQTEKLFGETRAAREDAQRSSMSWYNEHRPRQALGYRSPQQFRAQQHHRVA